MRILLVEDERSLAESLARVLTRAGFAVDRAADGDEALHFARGVAFDAIVLDIGLPRRSGLEVCATLRKAGARTPILLLTARDAVADRVRGLDAGADDYLVKPFAMEELLARLRALLRREPALKPPVLAASGLAFDPAARVARWGETELDLSGKELAILELLLRHPGELVTRSELYEHVWNDAYDGASNQVDVYVSRIRRALRGAGAPEALIETRRGEGYVLRGEP